MGDIVTVVLKFFNNFLNNLVHARRQKRRLNSMLSDKRFPKGFRSTTQLANGIGADRTTTERLLLAIGARKSEVSDEWTLQG